MVLAEFIAMRLEFNLQTTLFDSMLHDKLKFVTNKVYVIEFAMGSMLTN